MIRDEKPLPATISSNPAGITRQIERLGSNESLCDAKTRSEVDDHVSIRRIWKMSLPEWKFLVFGSVGGIMSAMVFPGLGLFLTKITFLSFEDKPRNNFLSDARLWSVGFLVLGILAIAGMTLQNYAFGVVAQRLTSRVRLVAFKAMLHQEVSWFDQDENASGALVTRLATDSATLQTMTSDTLNQTLVNLSSMGIAFGIAFYYCWQMTLLLLATLPIFIFTGYIQGQMTSGTISNKKVNDADSAAGALLSEAISSIRTVASLHMEGSLNAAYTGDQAKAKKAVARIFSVIDRKPEIDSTSGTGEQLTHINGDIEFKNVAFTYPSRPVAQIYTNYNLKIKSGQTVALVGASGSGKSTAISFLERFYDPAAGTVTLDGADLRKLRLPWLREHISLVSQEPVLIAGTIAENIAMGKPGATREDVIEAAKKANAYDFISNFPNGFDTDVGDRGAQVSGGQKQRIAIARAILRDPEVLLLDEATSALDNESERVVQESLDRLLALKKRTTIIVAHRLSTIRNADLIAVTKDGAIVEQGTHDELMRIEDGVYKGLVARQI